MSKNSPKQSLEAVKEWLAWMKNNKGKKNVTPYGRQISIYIWRYYKDGLWPMIGVNLPIFIIN